MNEPLDVSQRNFNVNVLFDDVNSLVVKDCGIEMGRDNKIPRVFTRTQLKSQFANIFICDKWIASVH